MKKAYKFLLFIFIFFTLVGCDLKNLNISKPIGIGDEIPTSVIIDSNKIYKITVGETLQLQAKVIPDTAPQDIVWSSNDNDLATVSDEGLVLAKSEGSVTIRATAEGKTDIFGSFFLVIEKEIVLPETIDISGPTSLYVNDIIRYECDVTPANATFAAVWESENEEIFTVDQSGRVNGQGLGTADLILTVGTLTARKTIEIKEREVAPESLSVIGRDWIEVGHSMMLRVIVQPINAKDDVVWSSSNEQIATVDNNGLLFAHQEGTVVVTAVSLIDSSLIDTFDIEIKDYSIEIYSDGRFLEDAYKKTKDSVLGITNYKRDNDLNTLKKSSSGTGTVYKVWFKLLDGSYVYNIADLITFDDVDKYCYYIMTNKHVIKDADAVKVYLSDEDYEIEAAVMQMDDKVDLAVVYFEYDSYIHPLRIGDSSLLNGGNRVYALGNPSGHDFSQTITDGIISHPKRFLAEDTDNDGVNDWDGEYIQHQVPINPGNSGGPLLNLSGEIVGMNTLKFASKDIDNMGFSIPSNVIAALLPLLEEKEKPIRATLGVTVLEVRGVLENPQPDYPEIPEDVTFGLYVLDFMEDSIAHAFGTMENDIILSFNEVNITKSLYLRQELQKVVLGSGVTIEMKVYREGEIITLHLTF